MARKLFIFFVLFVGLAVFSNADEAVTSAAESGATATTTTDESSAPVETEVDCSSYTSCTTCSGSCGWCGDSDNTGYCTYCPGGYSSCDKPATCSAKYWTHNICPSALDALVLGLGAIIGIVVASLAGFCCLVALIGGLVFCLCCRPRHNTYVIAGQPHVHHIHQEQPILHHGYHHHNTQKGYSAV